MCISSFIKSQIHFDQYLVDLKQAYDIVYNSAISQKFFLENPDPTKKQCKEFFLNEFKQYGSLIQFAVNDFKAGQPPLILTKTEEDFLKNSFFKIRKLAVPSFRDNDNRFICLNFFFIIIKLLPFVNIKRNSKIYFNKNSEKYKHDKVVWQDICDICNF